MTRVVTAVVLVVCLAVGACSGGGDDDVAGTTSGSSTSTPTTADATSTTAATDVSDAAAAVEAWIDAVADVDADRAWELLAEPSREGVGGREVFGRLVPEMGEGWAAWARSEDVQLDTIPLDAAGRPGVALVVLSGTVAQEGPPGPGADAMPVHLVGGEAKVSPFEEDAAVELDPPSGTTVAPDDVLGAVVPRGPTVLFAVDATDLVEPTLEPIAGGGQRALLAVGQPLASGPHALTVVLLYEESIGTTTGVYVVGD